MGALALLTLSAKSLAEAPAPRPADAKAGVPGAGYVSPFAGYRGFREQPATGWREANERVFKLGGWKAFAGGAEPSIAEPLLKSETHERPPAGERDRPVPKVVK